MDDGIASGLSLSGLAHRCARETEQFFANQPHDPQYCYEIFRRAIVGRDERAWGLIFSQYHALVLGWVQRHSAFATSGEEAQYFCNRAFEKMWNAVPPDKFARFPTLSSLLRYLQLCVHSALLDHARSAERVALLAEVEPETLQNLAASDDVAPHDLAPMDQQAFWQEVRAKLNSEQEYQVVYGLFVLGLKPRQLRARYPKLFPDVRVIYRTKENVLARLRRDSDLLERLQEYA